MDRVDVTKLAVAGSLALIAMATALHARRLVRSHTEHGRTKKKKAKARHKHRHEIVDGEHSDAHERERSALIEFREARRAASTMTAATIAWFSSNVETLLDVGADGVHGGSDVEASVADGAPAEAPRMLASPSAGKAPDSPGRPAVGSVSVLSIGCGDGAIDIAVLRSIAAQPGVTKVHYVGLEPSENAATAFRARLAAARASGELGPNVATFVLHSELDDRPVRLAPRDQLGALARAGVAAAAQPVPEPSGPPAAASSGAGDDEGTSRGFPSKHQFDLVLLVHVLQELKSPLGALQRAALRTKPGGRVVVVQPVAGALSSLVAEEGDHQRAVLTTDDLRQLLLQQRLQPSIDSFETELDVTACLQRTAAGIRVMSDCVGRDLRKAKEAKLMRVLKGLWRVATIDPDDGSAHVKEPCAVLIVQKPHPQPVPGG